MKGSPFSEPAPGVVPGDSSSKLSELWCRSEDVVVVVDDEGEGGTSSSGLRSGAGYWCSVLMFMVGGDGGVDWRMWKTEAIKV